MLRYIDEVSTSYSKIVDIENNVSKLGGNPDFFKVLDLYQEFCKHSNYLGMNDELLSKIEYLKLKFKTLLC